jgi:hypothetical protein
MVMSVQGRRRAAALAVAAVVASGLGACGTWGGEQIFAVGPEHLRKDNPLSASFGVKAGFTYDQVWKAAMAAMSNGMTVMESHKPSGEIKSRIGAAPSGKVVGFWITPTTPTAASYTIQTLSVRPIGITTTGGTGWEPKVVEDFNAALNQR